MSGNAQTEVITGPAANATVLGSKTFKQYLDYAFCNTSGSVTIELQVQVLRQAELQDQQHDGVAMVADITNQTFTISSGNAAGLKVKYSGLGSDATIIMLIH